MRTSRRRWLCAVALGMAAFAGGAYSADPPDCHALADDAERLHCYDAQATATDVPEKEHDLARRGFALLPHRPSYILHSYSSDPNLAPYLAVDPNADLQYQEIKFQISVRVPIFNKIIGDRSDLWFGYTQKSFWQAYNWAHSAPFRETDYEPELGLTYHTDDDAQAPNQRLWSLGFAHQSNGQPDPLSRSWNRIWGSAEWRRENWLVNVKTWYRLPESKTNDNNPDILDYCGRIELRGSYKRDDQVYSVILRNNLRTPDNRSGVELDWSLPFSRRIKGLVQYYYGYGESLIDYNARMRRLGLGVVVEDWL